MLPALGVMGGIAAGYFSEIPPVAILPALLLAGWLWRRKSDRPRELIALALLFATTAWWHAEIWEAQNSEHPMKGALPLAVDSLSGTILPQSAAGGNSRLLWADSCWKAGRPVPIGARFLLYFPENMDAPPAGSRLLCRAVLVDSLSPPRNPGAFDAREYYGRDGIWGKVRIRDVRQVTLREGAGPPFRPALFLARRRQSLAHRLERGLEPEAAAFVQALLLGLRKDLDGAITENFRRAGVVHVLAISGLHVGFFGGMVYLMLSFLGIGLRWQSVWTALLVWLYALMIGTPSVIRAALMGTLVLVGMVLERRGHLLNALCAALILMLVWQPMQLFGAGFQLSFAAVGGIGYGYSRLAGLSLWLDDLALPERVKKGYRLCIGDPLRISLATQLATLPVLWWHFQEISLIGLVLNLLIVPLTGLLLMGSFAWISLDALHPVLGSGLAELLSRVVGWEISLVGRAADLPGAACQLPQLELPGLGLLLALVVAAFNIAWWWRDRLKRCLVLTLLISFATLTTVFDGKTHLVMLDVGQGDAMLLRTRVGEGVLIDCGPSGPFFSPYRQAIAPVAKQLNIRSLRAVFISHLHADHYGGLPEILRQMTVDSLYLPEMAVELPALDSVRVWCARQKTGIRMLKAGDIVAMRGGERFYTLGPVPGATVPLDEHSLNDGSLVLKFVSGEVSALLVGDLEGPGEIALRNWAEMLAAPLLKTGHHGSATSSSPAFLDLIRPRIALISSGKYNRFGHPAPNTLNEFIRRKCQIRRTDRAGAIWMTRQNSQWREKNWR
ncbi:MAG: DNA internalization-related competence protein ComEC/Rec2 [Calditrichaeota bacterium]|nr:DNA internalization-related competence protein ComEC/Rec2 [Calditrichota bacterium]